MNSQPHGRQFAVAAVLLLLAAFLWRGTPVAKLAKTTKSKSNTRLVSTASATNRKIYPFSVIYGGAHSGEELARARKLDAVVAQHYTGFGKRSAVDRLSKDAFMYVSYRKANQVFWTKTKHRIPQGELVLSDGENLARTRCGNRLSPKPQAPVAAGNEPTDEAMDIPDGPKPTVASANPAVNAPDADFFVPANPADAGSVLSPGGPSISPVNPRNAGAAGDFGNPYVFGSRPGIGGPFFGGLGYPGAPGTSGGSTGDPAGVATNLISPENGLVTPEPGTRLLLLLALLLGTTTAVGYRRNRAKTNRSK